MNPAKHENNLLSSVIQSLYDARAYAALATRPTAHAIIYLICLALLCASITAVPIARKIDSSLERAGRSFSANFPDFIFNREGFNVKEGFPIISINEEEFVWLFDLSGKKSESILDEYPQGALISNHVLKYKKNESETVHYNLEALKQFAPITKAQVERLFSYHRAFTGAIVVFFLLLSVFAKFASALLVALLGKGSLSFTRVRAPFDTLFRLSMYALTLPIIIKTAAAVAKLDIPWFLVIYYGIGLFYLLRGIHNILILTPKT